MANENFLKQDTKIQTLGNSFFSQNSDFREYGLNLLFLTKF